MIIAIDFDGVIVSDAWPDMGEINYDVVAKIKRKQMLGDRFILWTCRNGPQLSDAIDFCASFGLVFDAVNDNLPDIVKKYGVNTRKVFADEYWDDRAVRKGE